MASVEQQIQEFGQLDSLSYQDTAVHRLDPRAKVLTTLVFLVCVVSFDKYAVLPLVPFLLYPVALAAQGNLPGRFVARKLIAVAPFAILVGAFNPLLDQDILVQVGSLGISGGWVSYGSILLRFTLTTFGALALIGTTSFSGVCMALERLGAPDVFASQLLFLYRYIFVLADEIARLARARALRSVGTASMGIAAYGSILGHLLLRTYARAQRIHQAMLCRGFDGHVRVARKLVLTRADVVFTLGWSSVFVLFRIYNVPEILGHIATGLIP